MTAKAKGMDQDPEQDPSDEGFATLDEENQKLAEATTPAEPEEASEADQASEAASEAELERQKVVEEAVALANADELPKLGGADMNPGAPAEDDQADRDATD